MARKKPLAAAKPVASASAKRPVKKKPDPLVIKPLLGMSTDLGVLLLASTPAQDPELSQFSFAAKDPVPRKIASPRGKARLSSAIIADEPTQSQLRVYLAFLPVPAGFPVVGPILFGARTSKPEDLFFTVNIEPLSKIDGKQLAKVLIALEKPFGEILPKVFGAEHALTKAYSDLIEKKRAFDFWQATQARVDELLKSNQGQAALAVLEPLVYQNTPHAQAEKLLGDILWRSYVKDRPDSPDNGAARQITTERLLFQYLLKVIGISE